MMNKHFCLRIVCAGMLVMTASVLFADGSSLNATKISVENVNSDSVYIFRKLIACLFALLPGLAVIIHSFYKKSFTDLKFVALAANTLLFDFVFKIINKTLYSFFDGLFPIMFFFWPVTLLLILLYFLITKKYFDLSVSRSTLYLLGLGYVAMMLSMTSPSCGGRSRTMARTKACYSNIRVIQGAVEMYNMDVPSKMEELDLEILKSSGYLNGIPTCPEAGTNTYTGHDLAGKGEVMCGPEPKGSIEIKRDFWGNELYNPYRKSYHGSLNGK